MLKPVVPLPSLISASCKRVIFRPCRQWAYDSEETMPRSEKRGDDELIREAFAFLRSSLVRTETDVG
eukprot:Skav203062  [mRNA]  locus=scaffold4669:82159:84186:- [translate_table: standard]